VPVRAVNGSYRVGAVGFAVGVALGKAAMDHAMAPRSLMLVNNEVILNPIDPAGPPPNELDDNVLLTRGSENAVAVVRVAKKRSALGNWCNDVIQDGCAQGLKLIALAPDSLDGAFRTSFNLTDLRAQRKNSVFGDTFRRPYQYRSICGFGNKLTRDRVSASVRAASVRVGLLQLQPCQVRSPL
jgi:hypothetical protein